jgi:tetratricopeptide (TPR) repeat protein
MNVLSGRRVPDVGAGQPATRLLHAFCAAAVCLAGLLVYYRSIGFAYVGIDDVDYVVQTAPVREGLTTEGIAWAFTAFRLGNWHPLTWLSYMLDVSLFGQSAGPKHAVNLLLHVCNSLLVYALAFRILSRDRHFAAAMAALFFVVHPLHVESVAWVAERKDVLCALFYFAAVHVHLDLVARPSRARYALLQLACALALMSKPMAVTLPFALLLLDYWPCGRLDAAAGQGMRTRARACAALVLEKAPVILMSAGVCVLTVMAQGDAMASTERVSLGFRLQNAVVSYATYLQQMILPVGLAPLYPLRPIDPLRQFLPALCVLSGLVALVLWRRRKAAWWATGLLWFLITLLPVIGLLQVGVQAHADRYMYIPSLGLLLAAAVSLSESGRVWQRRGRAIALVFLAFHAVIAWIQVGYWANDFMAYSRILAVTPRSWEAHVGLAAVQLARGDLEASEAHVRQAVDINSESEFVQAVVGNLALARRQNDAAAIAFGRAHALQPRWSLPMINLGVVMEREGRKADALMWYCKALAADPALDGIPARVRRLRAEGAAGPGARCDVGE